MRNAEEGQEPETLPVVVIHHANCRDGLGAAWAVERALGEQHVEHIAASYGEKPPNNLAGRQIIIVDFTYPLDGLRFLAERNAVLVLDHHKSAAHDLQELPDPPHDGFIPWQAGGLYALFDMRRSGAVIAWEYFHDTRFHPIPDILQYIQDRDLWRWELEGTAAIAAALGSYPQRPEEFRHILGMPISALVREGQSILRYRNQLINELVKEVHGIGILGDAVPAVNCPIQLASDICHRIMERPGLDIAAVYWLDRADSMTVSLRSKEGGPDVSEIARKFGGGGHQHAAGFTYRRQTGIELNPEDAADA